MKRGKYENLFKRKGKTSKRAAERLANMGASTRAEVLNMIANDTDLMELLFDHAVKAGVIEWAGHAGVWIGRDTAARQSAAEDWEP